MEFEQLQTINGILVAGNIIVMIYCIYIIQDNNVRWWLIRAQFALLFIQVILVGFILRKIWKEW